MNITICCHRDIKKIIWIGRCYKHNIKHNLSGTLEQCIAPDKAPFAKEKYLYFSIHSKCLKLMFFVLIRKTSLRHL